MAVSRRQAVREGWLHRVAVTVCREERGRILVHRRSQQLSRFPGLRDVVVGGAVNVGESYDPDPDEVARHGRLTEPELRSALPVWRFTPDSHEAYSRYLAFRTARS
jgi:hypothetical protein